MNIEGLWIDYAAAMVNLNNWPANTSKLLGPHNVTINTIIPGIVHTLSVDRWMVEIREPMGWSDDFAENERKRTRELLPQFFRRFGKPRELADVAAYLASPLAAYTNGSAIRVNGKPGRFV